MATSLKSLQGQRWQRRADLYEFTQRHRPAWSYRVNSTIARATQRNHLRKTNEQRLEEEAWQ